MWSKMIKALHGLLSQGRLVNNIVNVRIFSTHAGNGSQTQYLNYPSTTADFDRLFDVSYSNTTLAWSGTLSGSVALNHSIYTTLTGAGASVPNSGNYYSLEVTALFIPVEDGSYSFQIDSDDGSDLFMNGGLVVSYYGGHGIATPQSGSISLIAGTRYTLVARYQEYAGGEGLILKWKRPSQGTWTLQTSEIYKP